VTEGKRKIVPISLPDQVIPEVLINGIPDWLYEGNLNHYHRFCYKHSKPLIIILAASSFKKFSLGSP
jgi:hypothetical protein